MDPSQGLPSILVVCGIIAALFGVGTDLLAGLMKQGYRFDTQSASILSASGTPTRPYVLPFMVAANLLLIAFSLGVWVSTNHNWAMHVTAGLLTGTAIFALIAVVFFQMRPGEAMNSQANKWNVLFMGLSVLLFFLAIR